MSTKRNVITTGVVTFIVSMFIISALSLGGFGSFSSNTVSTTTLTVTTGTSQSTTVTPTTSITSTIYTTTSTSPVTTSTTTSTITSTTTATSTTLIPQGKGILSIQLTDPPNLPTGVTAVYVSYSDIMVHVVLPNGTKEWVKINSQGTINLTSLINTAQTISKVLIDNGNYNIIRFNITSALATYNGENYTAFVRTAMLTVPIVGGIEVNDSKTAIALIDLQPTVINIGSKSTPEFIISAVARAYTVPPEEEQKERDIDEVGHRMNLNNKDWWKKLSEKIPRQIKIISASISQNTLSVVVNNTGQENITLQLMTVSQQASEREDEHQITSFLAGTAVFAIQKNGTLTPIQLVQKGQEGQAEEDSRTVFGGSGYYLLLRSKVTLSYEGNIVLGFGLPSRTGKVTPLQIAPGTKYYVTIVAEGAVATALIVAS